jgi:2-haloacid dehalogenase
MPPVVVFDVNETLLDLSPIRDGFAELYGDAVVAGVWFGQLLKLSFVAALTDRYRPFTELGAAAFDMVAQARGVTVEPERRDEVVGRIRTLPPHPDSEAGLRLLRNNGYRLAALTNSPQATAEAQLANAGLDEYLDRIMSVEMVGTFKPAAKVYRAAAAELGVPVGEMLMVAAHDWDVAGAMAAGARGAFVVRPGQVLDPGQPRPDYVGSDIEDVARQLVAAVNTS